MIPVLGLMLAFYANARLFGEILKAWSVSPTRRALVLITHLLAIITIWALALQLVMTGAGG